VADLETEVITGEQLTRAAGPGNSGAAVAARFVAEPAASGGPAQWSTGPHRQHGVWLGAGTQR
jgi:hypothetical protein